MKLRHFILALTAAAVGCSEPTAPVVVASVSLSAANLRLASGDDTTLTATTLSNKDKVLPNRAVTWSSSDPAVATVDAAGKVTAGYVTGPADREAIITATSEGQSATTRIVVEPSLASTLTFGLTSITLAHGQQATLAPVVKDAQGNTLTGRSVNYVVSDTTIANIEAGLVTTGAFLGTVNRVTQVSANAGNASALFTVSVGPTVVQSLAINSGSGFVPVDGQRRMRATAFSPAGKVISGVPLTWISSVTSVATISSAGIVTPQAEGETIISVVAGGTAASSPIVVNQCGNGPAGEYPIEIRYSGGSPNPAIASAFTCAVARIRAAITTSLPPVEYAAFNANACSPGTTLTETVPGLLIFATIEPIDGPGRVLGSAGPCYIRSGNGLTSVGRMRFDSADLDNMVTNGSLKNVIMHEMLHVLGVGVLWTNQNLLVGVGSLPRFTGTLAWDACIKDHAGLGTCATGVPVEDCVGITGCGAGTINSHWKELTFTNELMTGYINGGINPFSKMSIQSLADMGYGVDPLQADDYSLLPSASIMLWDPTGNIGIKMPEPTKPLGRVDRYGRFTPMAR